MTPCNHFLLTYDLHFCFLQLIVHTKSNRWLNRLPKYWIENWKIDSLKKSQKIERGVRKRNYLLKRKGSGHYDEVYVNGNIEERGDVVYRKRKQVDFSCMTRKVEKVVPEETLKNKVTYSFNSTYKSIIHWMVYIKSTKGEKDELR